jgi:hypothetical protein
MRVGYDSAPKRGCEDDDGQQKKDAADFEPEDAAHAAEGAQKATHTAAHGSTGLAYRLTDLPQRLPSLIRRAACLLSCTVLLCEANWNSLMHL